MTNDELKPCPFCGEIPQVSPIHHPFIICQCLVRGPQCETADIAADEWNTRPIEAALRARVEKYEMALKEIAYCKNDGIAILSWRNIARRALED